MELLRGHEQDTNEEKVHIFVQYLWDKSVEIFWVSMSIFFDEAEQIEATYGITGVKQGLLDRLKDYEQLNLWYPETD